jgi:hypothetical protein
MLINLEVSFSAMNSFHTHPLVKSSPGDSQLLLLRFILLDVDVKSGVVGFLIGPELDLGLL